MIVDDDRSLQKVLEYYLLEQGFETATAQNSAGMFAALKAQAVALVLLDLRLGAEEGLDALRELRRHSDIPVIIITGHRRGEIDRIVGLELGADDYMVKPFSLRELLARIRTVLRRREMVVEPLGDTSPGSTFTFGGWVLNRKQRRLVNPAGKLVPLTKSEFALLCAFVDAPGRSLSREDLLQATRVHDDVFDRSIDVQILRLRRKLEAVPSQPRLITTERGYGYCFNAEVTVLR